MKNLSVGHGVSLLRWRSGGFEHPHVRRLIPSCRHQLSFIARRSLGNPTAHDTGTDYPNVLTDIDIHSDCVIPCARISRQNGRECDEDCNVKDRSSCQRDPNRNASQIIVHSLSSEPENNQFVLRKKLNSTEDRDFSFIGLHASYKMLVL